MKRPREARFTGLRWASGIPILPPNPVRMARGTVKGERAEAQLYLRGPDRMRQRAPVRAGERAAAVAANADVRSHREDRRHRRPLWQGRDRGRTRREARPLVLRLPLQGRSGDAGLPAPRCAVAASRLLPGLDEG